MGLFSYFKREDPLGEGPPGWPLDLGALRLGPHALGEPPDSGDFWGCLLRGDSVWKPDGAGFGIGMSGGVLDHVLIDVGGFHGGFSRNGQPLAFGPETTVEEVVRCLGEPYWIDRSDGEVILFYEPRGGAMELQFEFPEGGLLGFITLARDGVLSDAAQRAAYGCNRPWPPTSGDT